MFNKTGKAKGFGSLWPYGVVIVLAAIIISAGAIVALYQLSQLPPPLTGDLDVQVKKGDTVVDLDFSSVIALQAVQGASKYQNRFGNWRGAGTYIGVSLASLVELVGGMDQNDVVRINATDGYYQYYAYHNLYPNSTIAALQGQFVLAYALNGTTPTTWVDGPTTAFLPTDGAYSNDDANSTTHPAWFFGSAGARWVRNVAAIEVIPDVYIGGSYHVTVIDDDTTRDVYLVDLTLMKQMEAFSAYQKFTGNWGGNGTYKGVMLADLVDLITTIDSDDVVNVSATDGYTQSFAYYNLYPNATIHAIQGDMILAYSYNGTVATIWTDGPRIAFLAPDGGYSNTDASLTTYPAWFFGSAGARWVSNVLTITIIRDSLPP
ncbi:MAG: hypothetical protein ACFE89_02225 [Candidatus Hodarchaeota archaeon]